MRNNRRNEPSSAPTAPKQPRNDDPEGLGSFGKGLLDARGARDYWWYFFTGPIYVPPKKEEYEGSSSSSSQRGNETAHVEGRRLTLCGCVYCRECFKHSVRAYLHANHGASFLAAAGGRFSTASNPSSWSPQQIHKNTWPKGTRLKKRLWAFGSK